MVFKWAGAESALMCLWLRLNLEEELCHSPSLGMDSTDPEQPLKGNIGFS